MHDKVSIRFSLKETEEAPNRRVRRSEVQVVRVPGAIQQQKTEIHPTARMTLTHTQTHIAHTTHHTRLLVYPTTYHYNNVETFKNRVL
jgi:hypothetical protein